MTTPLLRVAVLASGRGSNLAAMLAARQAGTLSADFVSVGSDKAAAPALQLAAAAGIPTFSLNPRDYPDRHRFDMALFERIAASGADVLVLAGFMRILDGTALAPWVGRVINIHPSLLPKYPGLHTHRRALEAGDVEHGASVHYITAELDAGPVIAQARLCIHDDDTEDTLAQRLLPLEHRLFPAVLNLLAERRLQWIDGAPQLDGQPLRHALRLGDSGLHASAA